MKRSKAEIVEVIIEAVLEIPLTVIGLGVGFVVYGLFGIDVGEHTDYEWLSLVGMMAFFAVLAVIGSIINLIQKKKKRKATGKENKDEEIPS